MSNRVIHFEIPVDEPQRAVAFYEAAFGWRISKWDGPMDYWNVKTGEGPGINGALLRRGTVSATTNTIDVDDLDLAIAKVEQHGGSVVVPPMVLPSIGRFCYARDTEGNLFGLMQLDPEAPAPSEPPELPEV
ncbi:MAG: Glyoxalase [Candidatus Eremiobacteraeota bacterium]|nr:Glyoxalase [Candidatus Eremiobacteraeota bacterium]